MEIRSPIVQALRSEERRVGKAGRSLCDWSSDVCSSDLTGDVAGLEAGVYHFDPLGFQLSRIRKGDYRTELAAVSDESIALAPATIAFTSMAWKNAWKYEARSYRH